MQGKWRNGESSVLLDLLFQCTHQIFINHRRSGAPRIIMHIFASFIKVSHPSPYHWISHGIFSIHLTKLMMNVNRFHVSCIQETDYSPHFTCGGLLDFLEHCKHTGRCVNLVRFSANRVRAFPKDQQTLHACAPLWPQRCSGNICKRKLFCGYASYPPPLLLDFNLTLGCHRVSMTPHRSYAQGDYPLLHNFLMSFWLVLCSKWKFRRLCSE
jgi:hypothetical protein